MRIIIPEAPQLPSYMQKDVSIQTFTDMDPAPWPNYRAIPKSKSEDVLTGGADKILEMISNTFGQGGIGQFLDIILTCCDDKSRTVPIQRRQMVQSWLQGRSTIRAFDNVLKMYNHKYSYPSCRTSSSEREYHFSPTVDLSLIHYTRIAISSWAVRLVGNRAHKGIGTLMHLSETDRSDGLDVVTWFTASNVQHKDLMQFDMKTYIEGLKQCEPVIWYLTKCMAASQWKGIVVTKRIRPHPLVRLFLLTLIFPSIHCL